MLIDFEVEQLNFCGTLIVKFYNAVCYFRFSFNDPVEVKQTVKRA